MPLVTNASTLNVGIDFTIVPNRFGLFEEDIQIYSVHNLENPLVLTLRLFVDEKSLDVFKSSEEQAEANAIVDFNVIYLQPKKSDTESSPAISTYEVSDAETVVNEGEEETKRKSEKEGNEDSEEAIALRSEGLGSVQNRFDFEISSENVIKGKQLGIRNTTGADMHLRVRTDLNLCVEWDINETTTPGTDSAAVASYLLKAGREARAFVSLPVPTLLLLQRQAQQCVCTNENKQDQASYKIIVDNLNKGLIQPITG